MLYKLRKKYKLLLVCLLCAMFIGSFISHKERGRKRRFSDFHCFYTTGERLLKGQNIYIVNDKEIAEFRYAPIFAVIMSGLARFDEDTADTIWYTFNFILLFISIFLINKLAPPHGLTRNQLTWLYALFSLGLIRQMYLNLNIGQTNILIMTCLLGGLYLIGKRREALGSALFAFSAMIKYVPLLFIPYFIYKKQYKAAFFIALWVLFYFWLPSLVIGFKTNLEYLGKLMPFLTTSSILDPMTILDSKNQSLISMIHRYFYVTSPPMPFQFLRFTISGVNFIFAMVAASIYLSIFYTPRNEAPRAKARGFLERNTERPLSSSLLKSEVFWPRMYKKIAMDNRVIDYALLLICIVLFNLNAWMHNYILLSLGNFIIIAYLIKKKFKDKITLMILMFSYLLIVFNFQLVIDKFLVNKFELYAPFTFSAILTFIALLRIKLQE